MADSILDEIMDEAAMLGELRLLPSQATDIDILSMLEAASGIHVGANSVAAKLAVSSFHNAIHGVNRRFKQLH